jgi:hypothetical protein
MFSKDETVPTVMELLKGKKPAGAKSVTLDKEPGTDFNYTNMGYAVLQVLLEDVTRRPFADFMKETVFSPLGMMHSRFEQPLSKELLPQAAIPYDLDGKRIEKGPNTVPNLAAGGLWTTPSDLSAFAIHIQDVLAGKSNRVISQKTAQQMLEPGKGDYGLGFVILGKPPRSYFDHSGSTLSYQCDMMAYKQGDGVVIMTSSENGFPLINDIKHTLAHAYGWTGIEPMKVQKESAKIDPGSLEGLAGEYKVVPSFTLHVTRDQNRLFMRLFVRDIELVEKKAELFPKGNGSFYRKDAQEQFDFILGKDGRAEKLIFHYGDREMTAPRIDPIALARLDTAVTIEPIRPYLDLKQKYDLSKVWGDSAHGASSTVKVKNESIHWRYNSAGWGCGISIPCNVPPLSDSATIDLRGYRYLCFDAKLDKGKTFAIYLNEYKSAANNLENYSGVNGSDAEAFIFGIRNGTGKWSPYRIDMTDLDLRTLWGNQKGNRILDLQSTSLLEFQVAGGKKKGMMEIKRVRFEKD